MGKSKKVQEKLRIYYRGVLGKPTKVATDDQMKVIADSLQFCLQQRASRAFETIWNDQKVSIKFVVGLSACLRLLERKLVKALIYCDTAGKHLIKYLTHSGSRQNIPVIQAKRLVDLAPKFGLNTLLVVSLVDHNLHLKGHYKEADPKPKSDLCVLPGGEHQQFDNLVQLLRDPHTNNATLESNDNTNPTFQVPTVDRVQSTGKSRAKKSIKRQGKHQKKQ